MKKLFSWKNSDASLSLGLLFLRVAMGGMMIPIGYQKLVHFAEYSKGFLDPFGIGSTASYSLVVFAEFFCACLLVLGLLTRLATIPLIITMAVVVFKVGKGQLQSTMENPGAAVPVLFLIGFIAILFTGPGKISLDRFIAK
ncbi:MAG TPA: DoxX family protein [Chitinophagaceae bacterium]|jgi:putative oxidoreductase|nr:DoxX family protein [Chitinophagaceae bacterium]